MITPKVTLDRYPLSLCTPCSDWQYPCPRHARICPRGSLPRSSQRHRNVRARGGAGSEICINSCRPRRTTCTVQQGGEHKRPFGQPGLGSSCARQASPPLADARARCLVFVCASRVPPSQKKEAPHKAIATLLPAAAEPQFAS